MHILFLTDNFPPEVNAPASRTFEHCREWVKSGCKVTVITGAPNFPNGRVFKGYKNKLWHQETIDGIRVVRVWTFISANEGFMVRILDYVSFMLSAFIASFFVRKVNIIIGTSPQFFTVWAARLASFFKQIPWIFELRDLWPESIKAVGAMKDSRILSLLEKIEMYLYRKASMIVSVTEAFRNNLIARGINPLKIQVITNGVDVSHFSPGPKNADLLKTLKLEKKFIVGYVGTHGMAHALGTLLDAAKKFLTDASAKNIVFLFLGDGAMKKDLERRAADEKITNVIFLSTVSKAQLPAYWSLLDVSLVHLKKTDLFKTVIPSKIFESMAMSVPILLGVEGEAAAIVKNNKTGLCFEPENVDALCVGIKKLKNDRPLYQRIKRNGPKAVRQYERTVLAQRMLGLIRQTADHR